MNVKFVANARYGKKIAAQVRDYLCQMEAPEIEEQIKVYDEEEDIEEEIAEIDEDWERENANFTVEVTDKPDMDVLQTAYYEAFPQSAPIDQEQKQLEFHGKPRDEEMPEIRMKLNEEEEYDDRVLSDSSYMNPVLQTHLEPRHPINQAELVYSVFNRNYMPAKEDSLIFSMGAAQKLFDVFLSCLKRYPRQVDVSDADISKIFIAHS